MGAAFNSGSAPSCADFVKAQIAKNGYKASAANDVAAVLHFEHYSALIACIPGMPSTTNDIIAAVASSDSSNLEGARSALANGFHQEFL
ncbi:hypothetical protein [uncultured Sphingomonas sp.]